ncbi:hypothetical protein DSM112329_04623 [Paraconexibacter sp. AEG42_29]|uniref:Uncharacterized protein n=1 Tax=Paraconexibacter sp. AEG42_29 TaxID=2997339 RepID=A0AAU7B196_9ACTN
MATSTSFSATDDWATVLGSVKQFEAERPAPYGVAVESALEDLQSAATSGRPLAPLLAAATRAGCSADDIFHALGEVRGTGAQAPPL